VIRNPILMIVLNIAIIIWIIYELAAPGEAQNRGVVILEWILLVCAAAGLVSGALKVSARKP
jgi:hypothetical protein